MDDSEADEGDNSFYFSGELLHHDDNNYSVQNKINNSPSCFPNTNLSSAFPSSRKANTAVNLSSIQNNCRKNANEKLFDFWNKKYYNGGQGAKNNKVSHTEGFHNAELNEPHGYSPEPIQIFDANGNIIEIDDGSIGDNFSDENAQGKIIRGNYSREILCLSGFVALLSLGVMLLASALFILHKAYSYDPHYKGFITHTSQHCNKRYRGCFECSRKYLTIDRKLTNAEKMSTHFVLEKFNGKRNDGIFNTDFVTDAIPKPWEVFPTYMDAMTLLFDCGGTDYHVENHEKYACHSLETACQIYAQGWIDQRTCLCRMFRCCHCGQVCCEWVMKICCCHYCCGCCAPEPTAPCKNCACCWCHTASGIKRDEIDGLDPIVFESPELLNTMPLEYLVNGNAGTIERSYYLFMKGNSKKDMDLRGELDVTKEDNRMKYAFMEGKMCCVTMWPNHQMCEWGRQLIATWHYREVWCGIPCCPNKDPHKKIKFGGDVIEVKDVERESLLHAGFSERMTTGLTRFFF